MGARRVKTQGGAQLTPFFLLITDCALDVCLGVGVRPGGVEGRRPFCPACVSLDGGLRMHTPRGAQRRQAYACIAAAVVDLEPHLGAGEVHIWFHEKLTKVSLVPRTECRWCRMQM